MAPGPVVPLDAPLMSAMAGLRQASIARISASWRRRPSKGRGLGARGLDGAAEYAAASLALAGVAPVPQAGGTLAAAPYFHPVPLREIARQTGRVVVEWRRGEAVESWTFVAGATPPAAGAAARDTRGTRGFAGYGIREMSPPRDDYRGLDVKDKIVLIEARLPAGDVWKQPELLNATRRRTRTSDTPPSRRWRRRRARGRCIAIERDGFVDAIETAAALAGPTFFLPISTSAEGAVRPCPSSACRRGGRPMLAVDGRGGGPLPGAAEPRALDSVTASVVGGRRRARVRQPQRDGDDPRVGPEAARRGGDYRRPHGPPGPPGRSHVSRCGRQRLRRGRAPRDRQGLRRDGARAEADHIFAFWTGEEEGHLGSEHYVRHPAWPLERTACLPEPRHDWPPVEAGGDQDARRRHAARERRRRSFGRAPCRFHRARRGDVGAATRTGAGAAARASGLALHLDRTDGKHGGSDYRAFARRACRSSGSSATSSTATTSRSTRPTASIRAGAEDGAPGAGVGVAAGRSIAQPPGPRAELPGPAVTDRADGESLTVPPTAPGQPVAWGSHEPEERTMKKNMGRVTGSCVRWRASR